MNLSLDPQTNWNLYDITHLLRKVSGSYSMETIQAFANLDPAKAVTMLLQYDQIDNEPLIFVDNDPAGAIGETWVDAPYDKNLVGHRMRSVLHWIIENLGRNEVSARAKMLLFWHNHYPIREIFDAKYQYNYWRTLDRHALGNARDMCKAMTIDPAMLRFLNGTRNVAGAPNENYARELFELFSIGKGPLIAAGDYTNYTEDDIQAAARILTGWKAVGFRGNMDQAPAAFFEASQHDTELKTLSEKFDDASFINDGDAEYANLIDRIFEQGACAEFLCRKLYRWFVHQEISEDVELQIIQPLRDLLIEEDYALKPVLHKLLSSQHFYDMELRACTVKSPHDFIYPIITGIKMDRPNTAAQQLRQHLILAQTMNIMGMGILDIPEVAGWKPYYQAPSFDKLWVNNVSLAQRMSYVEKLLNEGLPYNSSSIGATPLKLIETVANFDEPEDPNKLIEQFALLYLPLQLQPEQVTFLKQALIPGLPDFEWTTEYTIFLQSPDDENLRSSIENKLKQLLHRMWSMPEFQLF